MRRAVRPLPALLLAACATWVPTQGVHTLPEIGVQADLPAGWMRYERTRDAILITRDGLALAYVRIYRAEVTDEVPNTQRKLRAGMLPHELAEVDLDSERLANGVTNFELLENAPVRVDGHDCYRLGFTHRLSAGLKVRTLQYGCLVGEHVYRIRYRAAAQHYFEAYRETFEALLGSVRLRV